MSTKTAPVERKRRRAQISRKDLREVAKLVARRLTIAEACECLGLRARSFYQWTERHENLAEYEAILTRVRGQYIRANLAQMEKAAGGKGGVRHDWRAADRLNAITAPDRYATPQPPLAEPPAAVPPSVVNCWIALAFPTEPSAVVDTTSEPKQLPESTAQQPPQSAKGD
jgi:hypothetical protein